MIGFAHLVAVLRGRPNAGRVFRPFYVVVSESRVLCLAALLCFAFPLIPLDTALGMQRFPPPQFSSGHELPTTAVPNPRADAYEYLDVGVLLAALSLASYLALRRRSRRGIFLLVIFSLLYFGFWRKGCVCAIGAIQNVALAFSDHNYTVPIAVVVFFISPLVFTLFFGRTFCGAVCPLGAIQDVMLLRPVRVPFWLDRSLRMFTYIYLGLAVLFAATGSAFVICRYDPFVAFFRRTGSFNMFILGAGFLLIGLFIGRPYCRYLCPYSVLLGWMSRSSKWHLTITPGECIQCRLCEDSCPFGAMRKPTEAQISGTRSKKALTVLIAMLPVLVAIGVLVGVRIGPTLSRANPTVSLARRIWLEDTGKVEETTDASDTFRTTGRPTEELYQEALNLNEKFVVGGGILGAFLGLIIGMKMIQFTVRRSREDYVVDRTNCLSCGRCIPYCPVDRRHSEETSYAEQPKG